MESLFTIPIGALTVSLTIVFDSGTAMPHCDEILYYI